MARGGIFRFRCPVKCGQAPWQQTAWEGQITTCPSCETIAARVDEPKPANFSSPHLSRALGVSPDQIPEAKQMFPHHEFAPDGRMVFRNAQEFDRAKKDLGFEHTT